MTNYEKLKKKYLKNPEFVKAYKEASIERKISEAVEKLEVKILYEKPPIEDILKMLNTFKSDISKGKFAGL